MADGKFIAYYRVSTDKQGKSGLGLDAQQAAVRAYLNGGQWELVGEFTEIESGKRDDRLELAKAIAACKKHKATLIISKLDRLARSVEFIARLMNSGVEFIACDNPTANKLTVHILAAVAEAEREMIAKRTKECLAQAKARGVLLGNRRNLSDVQKKGAEQNAVQANAFARNVMPVIDQIKATGITSLKLIANALNARGVKTARGGTWQAMTVKRILDRAA